MKALILAGGRGTRLRPLTYTSAKQLVPVANKPVLFYGLEAVSEAGLTEVGMIVGDTAAEIKKAVGDGSAWGLRVTYIHQEAPLGLAHAVLTAQDFLKDTPFIVYLGDNLLLSGISDLVADFRAKAPNAQILLAQVDHPQDFGVAELNGEKVVRLIEKPKQPPSNYALVGVYALDPNFFTAARAIKPSWRGELEITDALQYLIDHGFTVHSHFVTGWWKDTGKLEDLLEANRMILDRLEPKAYAHSASASTIEGRVGIGEGTEIRNSLIRGPAIIGAKVKIENSFIGPFTSVGDQCTVVSSEIEHSIIMEGSVISHLPGRMVDSLIGKEVRIQRAPRRPTAFRFMLGDHSEVGLR